MKYKIGDRVSHWDNEKGTIVSMDSVLGKEFVIIELDSKKNMRYDVRVSELKKLGIQKSEA